MSTKYEVGSIVEGKVVKIKPFGAIVALEGGSQGLVHISQISESFVQNIGDHLGVGDIIGVKIISVDDSNGKISLSIKEANRGAGASPKAVESKDAIGKPNNSSAPARQGFKRDRNTGESSHAREASDRDKQHERHYDRDRNSKNSEMTFDEKMKEWLKQSNERQAGINKRNNRR